eukprot:jgi/Botrbrau1/11839/Bobra.0175s0004.1
MGSSQKLQNLLKNIMVCRMHSQDMYGISHRLLKHRIYISVGLQYSGKFGTYQKRHIQFRYSS